MASADVIEFIITEILPLFQLSLQHGTFEIICMQNTRMVNTFSRPTRHLFYLSFDISVLGKHFFARNAEAH